MITIRQAKPEDIPSIKKLAEKYNLHLSDEGITIVAENDNKEIIAFSHIRPVLMIEPFVSEDFSATTKLWEHIKTITKLSGAKILRCFAQPKHKKLYEKIGFYQIFDKHIPMEINFYK